MQEIHFKPFPLMGNAHIQTVASHFNVPIRSLSSKQWIIELPDKDRLSLEVSTPLKWIETDPSILMIHGLTGNHNASSILRGAHKFFSLGYRVLRLNLRNCGSGWGISRRCYHAGQSDDLLAVIERIKKESRNSPIIAVGYSLGGNILLKLSGELGGMAQGSLSGAIAICPSIDLYSSIRNLDHPRNRLYQKRFLKWMRKETIKRHQIFKDLPMENVNWKTFHQFNDEYLVSQYPFRSAFDYYDRCSSKNLIPEIAIPCKILFTEDDPIISIEEAEGLKVPQNVQIFKTKRGGHVGFIGNPMTSHGFSWLEMFLVDACKEFLR